jgi:hypothetical protein
MKKTLMSLLAMAGISSGVMAQDFTWNPNDLLMGFRSTDSDIKKAYIVNFGHYTNFTSLTTAWTGLNVASDLGTVFGENWYSSTKWGFLAFNEDNDISTRVASSVVGSERDFEPTHPFVTPSFSSELISTTLWLNSLSADTGSDSTSGRLSQGIWGKDTDNLNWVDAVLGNYYGAGPFEGLVTENLQAYTAVWDAGVTTNNAFTINSSGVIRVVPEPSTYALFGFAALVLIVAYRRAKA